MLMRVVRGRICSQTGNTRFTRCVCQKHLAPCQRNTVNHRWTCHNNNTLRTYQVWSSSKCGERKRTAGIRELERGRNEVDWRRSCLFARVCLFLPCVELWQAAPAAWICQPPLPWPWEEGQQLRKWGGGRRGAVGWVVRGSELKWSEGYKYLWKPDDHTVSQLETDGRALAETWLRSPPPETPRTHANTQPTVMIVVSALDHNQETQPMGKMVNRCPSHLLDKILSEVKLAQTPLEFRGYRPTKWDAVTK